MLRTSLASLVLLGSLAMAYDGGGIPPTAVSISSKGFEPATLDARRDEAVSLSVTSADGEHCFSLDAFRVEKRVLPGRTVAVRFTPDMTGRFPYRCCLHGGEAGTLVVTD